MAFVARLRVQMSVSAARVTLPSWDAVVLVCKACRKRADLPASLKSKSVASEVRSAIGDRKRRPRVLLTGCLGLCPKSAVAIAFFSSGSPPRIAAVEALLQVAPTVSRLLDAAE